MKAQMFIITMIFLVGLIFFVQQSLFNYASLDLSEPFREDEGYTLANLRGCVNEIIMRSKTCEEANGKIMELTEFVRRESLKRGYRHDFDYLLNCSLPFPLFFCTDSDGGVNYHERGTARDSTGSGTDTCNGETLTEYYCSDGLIWQSIYDCGLEGRICHEGTCVYGERVSFCKDLDEEGKLYILSSAIPSEDTCFTVKADNVVLDLGGRSITGAGERPELQNLYGVYVSGYNHITIRNGNISGFKGNAGIYLENSRNSNIENMGVNSNGEGIYLVSSSNNNLTNIVANSNDRQGIRIQQGSYNKLTNIKANRNGQRGWARGVWLSSTSYNELTGITIQESSGAGLFLDGSSYNIIKNITATQNGEVTEILSWSDSNYFTDGILDGIDMSDSTGIVFLNMSYDSEGVSFGGQLIRKWHYRAHVTDAGTGEPVEGATVTANNQTGDNVLTLVTGSNGYTPIGGIIEYVNNGGSRSDYYPYTITASKGGKESSHLNYIANANNLEDGFNIS